MSIMSNLCHLFHFVFHIFNNYEYGDRGDDVDGVLYTITAVKVSPTQVFAQTEDMHDLS